MRALWATIDKSDLEIDLVPSALVNVLAQLLADDERDALDAIYQRLALAAEGDSDAHLLH